MQHKKCITLQMQPKMHNTSNTLQDKTQHTSNMYVFVSCSAFEVCCIQMQHSCVAFKCNTLQTHCKIRYNTLQYIAIHCNTLQHNCDTRMMKRLPLKCSIFMMNPLQHTTTLQHTATHCNTLQHTATHCNTLQHTATHCNALQHTCDTSMMKSLPLKYSILYSERSPRIGIHLFSTNIKELCSQHKRDQCTDEK